MNIGGSIVIFTIAWWIAFQAALPWGVRSQLEAGEVEEGTEPGAPITPWLGRKMIAATIIATVVWLLAYLTIELQWVTLDDIPFLPGQHEPLR
jgi:predicted secreted protein